MQNTNENDKNSIFSFGIFNNLQQEDRLRNKQQTDLRNYSLE